MNQHCSIQNEFAWKVNGMLTTIRMMDDEIISLPQRQNLKSKHSAKYSSKSSFSQQTNKFYGKKQYCAQKSYSQQLSSHDATYLDTTTTTTHSPVLKTSSYISTNQFSSDPLYGSPSHTSPRTRSWSEASESDSSLSPVRRDFGKMKLQSQSHNLMDNDDDNQRKKVARSWSQKNSLQNDSSTENLQISFPTMQCSSLFATSPLNAIDSTSTVSLPYLYQQTSPNSTVSFDCQSSFQNDSWNNESSPATSSFVSSNYRTPSATFAAQRYRNISADESSSDELDYASIWKRDDEFLFSMDVPSHELTHTDGNKDVDRQFAACWTASEDDDCWRDDDFGGFDSVRTSREDPLSEYNDEYGCEDDWCGEKDFINEDLWSDVGSMKSLDFEEDSMPLSSSFIYKDGINLPEDTKMQQKQIECKQGKMTTLVASDHDIDDLCCTSETSPCVTLLSQEDNNCSSRNIADCLSSTILVTSQKMKENGEQSSSESTINTCEHPLTSRHWSKSDVQRLARAALLGETIDFNSGDCNHFQLYLSAQRQASSALLAQNNTKKNASSATPDVDHRNHMTPIRDTTPSPLRSTVQQRQDASQSALFAEMHMKRLSSGSNGSKGLSPLTPILQPSRCVETFVGVTKTANNQSNENPIVHPQEKKAALVSPCLHSNPYHSNGHMHERESLYLEEDTDDDNSIFAQLRTDTSTAYH